MLAQHGPVRGFPMDPVGRRSGPTSISDPSNPWIISPLRTWIETIKRHQWRGGVEIFNWFSHHPDLRPSKYDARFGGWTRNGLSAYRSNQGPVLSFKDYFNLQNQGHLRYKSEILSLQKFQKMTPQLKKKTLDFFQKAYTLSIKTRWEAKGKITVTLEEWNRICRQQCSSGSLIFIFLELSLCGSLCKNDYLYV